MRCWMTGCTLAAAVAAGVAQAPAVHEITPVFHELVAFSLPGDFQVNVPEHLRGPSYLRETVLRGETVEQWTQMITLTGARGAASSPGMTPQRLAATLAAGYKKACPETFGVQEVEAQPLSGHPAFIALVGCGSVPDEKGLAGAFHHESALIVTIAGQEDYYTIQWAERGPAVSKPLTFDTQMWMNRLKLLGPIRLCARVEGEAAPYPSCVGK